MFMVGWCLAALAPCELHFQKEKASSRVSSLNRDLTGVFSSELVFCVVCLFCFV